MGAETMSIFVLARTPGATETVEWTAICHSRVDFIYVHHVPSRWVSRYNTIENKRPFHVTERRARRHGFNNNFTVSHHATLAAAMKAARKWREQRATETSLKAVAS